SCASPASELWAPENAVRKGGTGAAAGVGAQIRAPTRGLGDGSYPVVVASVVGAVGPAGAAPGLDLEGDLVAVDHIDQREVVGAPWAPGDAGDGVLVDGVAEAVLGPGVWGGAGADG